MGADLRWIDTEIVILVTFWFEFAAFSHCDPLYGIKETRILNMLGQSNQQGGVLSRLCRPVRHQSQAQFPYETELFYM